MHDRSCVESNRYVVSSTIKIYQEHVSKSNLYRKAFLNVECVQFFENWIPFLDFGVDTNL